MSQENAEIVRRSVEALNRRDLDGYLARMDPDVEITSLVVGTSPYRGHQGVRTYWQDLLGTVPDLRIEIEELRDLGELLLFAVRARGHAAHSDVPFEDLIWTTAKARDGKCISWHAHPSKAEALEAVGLSE
jgi:ketosteroid isomerase-like protein